MEALRELRRKRKMTQGELARRLHVSQQCVAKWENGDSLPRADRLPAYAHALHCSVDTLLHEEMGRKHHAGGGS